MAHADPFRPDVLDALTPQIGDRLGSAAAPFIRGGAKPTLGETFAVWMLGLDATAKRGVDIRRLATPIGRWHHQIRFGNQTPMYARSMPLGPNPNDWTIMQVTTSPLAKTIDEAINWIDQNAPDDPLVRLLIVPAYYLHAFWLERAGQSHILILDMPDQYTRLKYHTLYDSKDFIHILSQEPHATGIPLCPPP